MSEMNIKKELDGVAEKKSFITYSHLSEHAFLRYEAVKKAYDIIHDAIAETGGVMPVETTDAYESLADLMESIKTFELDTIRNGR